MFRSASLFILTSFTVAVFTIFATSNVDSIVGIPLKIYSMQKNLIHIKSQSLCQMCPFAPRVCSEPGGQKPVLSQSLDRIQDTVVCNVRLVVRSWLITPRHAKLCELVGKRPAAILTGQWIRRTEPRSKRYILNWSQFHNDGVIACTSLLIFLSGKLHWSIFCDCPVF